jgi:hypothetical protein
MFSSFPSPEARDAFLTEWLASRGVVTVEAEAESIISLSPALPPKLGKLDE